MAHREIHRTDRIGWLRAVVHGANDGIVSTASLLMGVAAADAGHGAVMTAGIAGVVAGAMSMAVSEYVSVGSQADTQRADLERERRELQAQPEHEKAELTAIYVGRGLSPELAARVAEELTVHDALGAHARDELGITEVVAARPMVAALTSAVAFTAGGALPLVVAALVSAALLVPVLGASALAFLVALGAVGARLGGAPMAKAAARVGVMGAVAMALTAVVGALVGGVAL
ncbi:MAG: VIT family protein [Deltaproteobacteria bacterium]|nr:VIT family protein [Deltaproteobacteria bacterium]